MKNDEIKDNLLRILLDRGQISRQEFLEVSPCRPASMLTAINELKSENLVIEPGRVRAKTGRRSPNLCINPDVGAFVGLELQPQKLLGVLIDGSETVLAEAAVKFPAGLTAAGVPARLREILRHLREKQSRPELAWRGIGFADPGLVDVDKQLSLRAHNLPGWQNIPVAEWLRDLSGVKDIFIAPGSMMRAYAEYSARRPDRPESIALIELDTGIGGSFMKNGLLLTGSASRGMEIGHLVIRPGGPLCKCGNQGCLEAIAGEHGIRRRIGEMIEGKVATELRAHDSLDDFIRLVRQRDRAAQLLAGEICNAVAGAVTVVVTLLNPSMVIFTGRLSQLDELLLDTVRRALNVNCFYGAIEKLHLEISTLGEHATALGAAQMAKARIIRPAGKLWI